MNAILWRLTFTENIIPYALCDSSDTMSAIAFGSKSSVDSNRYNVGKEQLQKQELMVTTDRVGSSVDYRWYKILQNYLEFSWRIGAPFS
jgi:hypothetical protein